MEKVIFKALSCQNTASGFCYIILHISALYFKSWQSSYWTHLLQYGQLSDACGHMPWCHLTTWIPICGFSFWHLACTLSFPCRSLAMFLTIILIRVWVKLIPLWMCICTCREWVIDGYQAEVTSPVPFLACCSVVNQFYWVSVRPTRCDSNGELLVAWCLFCHWCG